MYGSRLFTRHLDEEEEVIIIVHKHWIKGFKYLFMPVLTLLIAWGLLYIAPFRAVFFAVVLWSVFGLLWTLRNFYDYYLDAWIITDQGIIDVEWHGWFHRQSTRVLYSDIQRVSYEIEGVVGTLMRFGTLSIEKISTGNLMSLENVKNPRAIEAIVLKNMEGYLHTKNLTDAKHVQEVLSKIVAREIHLEDFEGEDDEDDDWEDDDEEDDDE